MENVLVKLNGECVNIFPENGKEFSMKELEKYIGGKVTGFEIGNGLSIIGSDDESIIDDNRFFNQTASDKYQNLTDLCVDDCYGNIIFCKTEFVKPFIN